MASVFSCSNLSNTSSADAAIRLKFAAYRLELEASTANNLVLTRSPFNLPCKRPMNPRQLKSAPHHAHRRTTFFVGAVLVSMLSLWHNEASAQRIRSSVPAQQVPAWQLEQQQPVQTFPEVQYLRAPKKKTYLLDSGDVLGVFLEGILGQAGEAPPVHYPEQTSSLGPSIGYPIVVRENGTVSLPAVDPIPVRGLTVEQAEALIKTAYIGPRSNGRRILTGDSRIIVTLQRKRTINVIVVRQDNSRSMRSQGFNQESRSPVFDRSDQSARLSSIQLPAYDNDVFNALIETGGLPGLNAENVRVYRATNQPAVDTRFGRTNTPFPRSKSSAQTSVFPRTGLSQSGAQTPANHNGIDIPIRRGPAYQSFDNRQAALSSGDIVIVQARPTEVYYTSGLLRGGEFPLPRDKSLTVLDAIALAGGPTVNNNGGLGLSRLPPTELIVSRNNGRNGQVTIRVDLDSALNDPTQNILVAPGDNLRLRYKPIEQIGNFGIGTFNNFGLRRIFQ